MKEDNYSFPKQCMYSKQKKNLKTLFFSGKVKYTNVKKIVYLKEKPNVSFIFSPDIVR